MYCSYRLSIFAFLFMGLFSALTAQKAGRDNVRLAYRVLEERPEVTISFTITSMEQLRPLSRILSVDNVEGNRVTAVANRRQLEQFLYLEKDFEVVLPEKKVAGAPKSLSSFGVPYWNSYPSYQQYDSIMHRFATDFPEICRLHSIGKSRNGKDIFFVKISDNVDEDEPEPEFMYSSTMHGDEVVGYVLLIRLISYLLENYATDTLVGRLVNRMEIWINPLANPDGTYFSTDQDVSTAIRYNANAVDLNRNFPDPAEGPHPDGNSYQPETVAMMDFMEQHDFVLSANIHGGAEVMNYPWDTWYPAFPDYKPHADKIWFENICREYVDSAQTYGPQGYMNDLNNGVVNGSEWYSISGGRQDYITYFHQGREVTIEISNKKGPPDAPGDTLPYYWEYNYRSLVHFMEQALFGVRGTVKDAITGEPVNALISIPGHDRENSQVYSDPVHGFFTRLINEGSYTMEFTAEGYAPLLIENVTVSQRQTTFLHVEMEPSGTGVHLPEASPFRIYPNPAGDRITIASDIPGEPFCEINIFTLAGSVLYSERFSPVCIKSISISSLPQGIYVVEVASATSVYRMKLHKTY